MFGDSPRPVEQYPPAKRNKRRKHNPRITVKHGQADITHLGQSLFSRERILLGQTVILLGQDRASERPNISSAQKQPDEPGEE